MKIDSVERYLQVIGIVIFYALLAFLVYAVALKLFGKSPSGMEILTGAVVMILAFLFTATLQMGKFMGEMRSFKNRTENGFQRVEQDVDRLQEDIDQLQEDMKALREEREA